MIFQNDNNNEIVNFFFSKNENLTIWIVIISWFLIIL